MMIALVALSDGSPFSFVGDAVLNSAWLRRAKYAVVCGRPKMWRGYPSALL